MVFKLLLKLTKAQTEEEKLKMSVMYGWSLVGIGFLGFVIFGIVSEIPANTDFFKSISAWMFFISGILFMFRYTSAKPLLGAAAAGITVITIGSILENILNRRDGALSMGALFGVIVVLSFICLKNTILSWFYLIKETIRYVKHSKNRSEVLDLTLLQPIK